MKKLNALLLSKNPTKLSGFVNVLKTNFSDVSIIFDEYRIHDALFRSSPCFIILDSTSLQDIIPLVRTLHNRVLFHTCFIIVITQHDVSEIGLASLREGVSAYMPISLSSEEFYLRIKALINLTRETHRHEEEQYSEFNHVYPLEDRAILVACDRYLHHYAEKIKSIADLSFAVGLSERKITKLFKQHANVTVPEYIRQRKLYKAKELLITTRMTMNDIALELGYSSAANFSTAFKQAEHMSPSEYKVKNRKFTY